MKKIFIILSVVLLAVCCGKEEGFSGRFEVSGLQDSYSFAADLGQTMKFDIVSDNVLWDITISAEGTDWLTITPMRSLGGYETVSITPDDNNSSEARSCTFTLTSENGYSKTVSISQRGL